MRFNSLKGITLQRVGSDLMQKTLYVRKKSTMIDDYWHYLSKMRITHSYYDILIAERLLNAFDDFISMDYYDQLNALNVSDDDLTVKKSVERFSEFLHYGFIHCNYIKDTKTVVW